MLKGLGLTAKEMLRSEVVGEKLKHYGKAQGAAIARLQSGVEHYEKVRDRNPAKNTGSSNSSDLKGNRKMRSENTKCKVISKFGFSVAQYMKYVTNF